MFPRLATYSPDRGPLQWEPAAIDLAPDADAWPELPAERRQRLTTLLAGFRVAEDAVAEHLTPFADVAEHVDTMMMWIFFLTAPRRGPPRIVLRPDRGRGVRPPGDTPAERRTAAREHVPAALLELFEVRLPALAADLAAGRTGVLDGIRLYHMVLEGAVFSAGQRALLDDVADGALPGIREGVERVERDERWHVGFGVRCLTEAEVPASPGACWATPPGGRRMGTRCPPPPASSPWPCAGDGFCAGLVAAAQPCNSLGFRFRLRSRWRPPRRRRPARQRCAFDPARSRLRVSRIAAKMAPAPLPPPAGRCVVSCPSVSWQHQP